MMKNSRIILRTLFGNAEKCTPVPVPSCPFPPHPLAVWACYDRQCTGVPPVPLHSGNAVTMAVPVPRWHNPNHTLQSARIPPGNTSRKSTIPVPQNRHALRHRPDKKAPPQATPDAQTPITRTAQNTAPDSRATGKQRQHRRRQAHPVTQPL